MSEEKENIQFQLTDELIEKVELLVAENDDKQLQLLLNDFHYADIAEILDEISLDEALDLEDFIVCLTKMYGKECMSNVVGTLNRDIKFYGLTKTSLNLEGLDKHLRLIDSYKKLHKARANAWALKS